MPRPSKRAIPNAPSSTSTRPHACPGPSGWRWRPPGRARPYLSVLHVPGLKALEGSAGRPGSAAQPSANGCLSGPDLRQRSLAARPTHFPSSLSLHEPTSSVDGMGTNGLPRMAPTAFPTAPSSWPALALQDESPKPWCAANARNVAAARTPSPVLLPAPPANPDTALSPSRAHSGFPPQDTCAGDTFERGNATTR